uniref:Uncharacterized protein n=1 Tax=Oryza punctata TaxID=4537 RepID=A0A0E0JHF6_ORYPU
MDEDSTGDSGYLMTDKDSSPCKGATEQVSDARSPDECDNRKLSDDGMTLSYHSQKIRELDRNIKSLNLEMMVLKQEMSRVYACQAEVAEIISDLQETQSYVCLVMKYSLSTN